MSKVGKDGSGGDPLVRWRALAAAGRVPVLLARHGRTVMNAERRMAGRTDVSLDARGRAEAQALAARLAPIPLAGVYASPLRRAVETAEALGRVTVVEGLQEIDHGELEGRPSRSLVEDHPGLLARWRSDPTSVRLPGGETLGECRVRAWRALAGIVAQHAAGPPIVVVSHQMVLGALLLTATGRPLAEQRDVRQRNTALSLLGWREEGWELEFSGDTRHLDG